MDPKEELLIELVHFLSSGYKIKDPKDGHTYHVSGMSVKEIKNLINKPIPKRGGLTIIECLQKEGRGFFNELKAYLNKFN